jgi:hypothetical protein
VRVRVLAAALVALAFVPSAFAGGPSMRVGADEDGARQPDLAVAKAKMDLARAAGFDSIRITSIWSPGQTAPGDSELLVLGNALTAAGLAGIKPIVVVTPFGSSTAPTTADTQAQFAQYAASIARSLPSVNDVIVGNEPNSNRFWMPQFDADGTDAAATSYLQLLATTYDALKAVRPSINVIGGGLAPRGGDCATCAKPTHSPTSFIKDLGAAYRASGRTLPVMDVFDIHVYQDYSALPPSFEHPVATTISVPDYGKLVSLLGQAFDGTAQPGSTLPILYGEFGVESIPPAGKAQLYSGTEPTGTNPVDEPTQGAYYTEALKLAYCQPNVIGILEFKVVDESGLSGWQSGVYYPDETPKSSLARVRDSAAAVRAGTLTQCPDTVPPSVALTAPAGGLVTKGAVTLSATASDDVGLGKVEFLANGAVVGSKAVPPYTITWNSTGSQQVSIQAQTQDAAHNVVLSQPVTITVDNVAPETSITSAPSSPSGDANATFSFGSSEDGTFECALDGAAFASCASPKSYSGLVAGQHTFQVRAIDALGNVDATPATVTWSVVIVDTTPPETTIASGPSGTVNSQSASFALAASEPATFACSLDGAPAAPCATPASYSGLGGGVHTFTVVATDIAGNVDPTPATATWTVYNDLFAAALPIVGAAGTVRGTTTDASREPGEPRHAANNAGGRSVWFAWTAPRSGTAVVDTFGSSFDTLLGVYTGSTVSALARIASNDDYGGRYQSRVAFNAVAGVTYRIAVDGWSGLSGPYVLNWRV